VSTNPGPQPLAVTTLSERLARAAEQRRNRRLERRRFPLARLDSVRIGDGRHDWINFSGNDYLGLAADPAVAAAMSAAAADCGAGSGASPLVTGYHPEHLALERELAEFLERDAAVLYSSGYLANLGVATALAGRGDDIVQDRLCHASLIDGARLSDATLRRYAHADVEAARRQLAASGSGHRLLVTDGVFSMDGDKAPLDALAAAAGAHAATLVVDDAHGIGVTGPGGRGSVADAGLDARQVPVLVGTLGKALGACGAFAAGSQALIEHLVNEARSLVFNTALPPAVAAAGREALRCLQAQPWRRERLSDNLARFRAGAARLGIPLRDSSSPIQPLLVGDEAEALALSDALAGRGYHVVAIRPPTVPAGTARLRITLSTGHEAAHIDGLLEALDACLANR